MLFGEGDDDADDDEEIYDEPLMAMVRTIFELDYMIMMMMRMIQCDFD
jgi:hypothetical protein